MKTSQLPYFDLSQTLGLASDVYLKREDQHNYGSHKGRSIPLMIKNYVKDGWKNFVISSSGNAALAALLYVENHNKNNPENPLKLQVFIGKNIDKNKFINLSLNLSHSEKDPNSPSGESFITLTQVDNPKQQAFQLDKTGTHKLLRQSTDDTALEGYVELAVELDRIENLSAIFIPTSSGTTAQGLGEAFNKFKNKPQIHIVQTDFCHPIAELFNKTGCPLAQRSDSIAGAIVDKVAHRKNQVIEVIKQSEGSGWIVSDDEIKQTIELVEETCNLIISPNSALSVAGLKKAINNSWKWSGPVVCLITGA